MNAYHGDASVALFSDGQLSSRHGGRALQPVEAPGRLSVIVGPASLDYAGLSAGDLDHVAISRDPSAHLHSKLMFALSQGPRLSAVRDRLTNVSRIRDVKTTLAEALGVDESAIRAQVHRVEHHRAHMASSFFVSPFERAALLSIDGFGDFVSTMWGRGCGNKIEVDDWVEFPHSMGILYTAITQYLGFSEIRRRIQGHGTGAVRRAGVSRSPSKARARETQAVVSSSISRTSCTTATAST